MSTSESTEGYKAPAQPDSLVLAPAEMRRLGYLAVDRVVELWDQLAASPAAGGGSRGEMEGLFREPLPRNGGAIEDLIERFVREIVPNSLRVNHPRFFAYIPGSPAFPSVLADLLASGANTYVGTWLSSPAAATIELVVLDWFKEMLGLDPATEGLLVSGGSMANWNALCVAREEAVHARRAEPASAARLAILERGALYTSDQRHVGIDRAVKTLGLLPEHLRLIPCDSSFRIEMDALRHQIQSDRQAGLLPLAVIAHAGTTNTGACDPLAALADLAAEEQIWLHVDAAYGGFAALTPRGKQLLKGIDRADSIALDPHKWLYQTFECGSVLVRHPGAMLRAFSQRGDYLREVPSPEMEVTFGDRGLQLSRSFRALKIWMTLKAFGADAFAAAIDRNLDLALLGCALLEAEGFEIVARPVLGIVAFRILDAPDERQLDLIARINRSGEAFLSSTLLHGRVALRLCVLSPWTTEEDVRRTVRRLGSERLRAQEG